MKIDYHAAKVEYNGISYVVLRRDIVHEYDLDSDFVHYEREATEDDETFDPETDQPIVQLGDKIWDVHEPRKTTKWRVEIAVLLSQLGYGVEDYYVMGYGQSAEEAEIDALTRYASDKLRMDKVNG